VAKLQYFTAVAPFPQAAPVLISIRGADWPMERHNPPPVNPDDGR